MKKTLFLLIFLSFTACSSKTDFGKMKNVLNTILNKDETIERQLTREIIKDIKYPLIMVNTNGIIKQVLMLPISKRDNYHNYISGSGQGLTLNGANIIRTFGMNTNLISMEIENINIYSQEMNIKTWPLEINKTYKFITPKFDEKKVVFSCRLDFKKKEKVTIIEIEYFLTKVDETCSSYDHEFKNTYWASDGGFIWKSRQWISMENIYADLIVLKT